MPDKRSDDDVLLGNIKLRMVDLEALLKDATDHWGYEDPIYRFYHHSFKVYYLQSIIVNVWKIFQDICTNTTKELDCVEYGPKLSEQFLEIVRDGTSEKFSIQHNKAWNKHTRPIVEAFFHVKYMLEMHVKYGKELSEACSCLPSGWASVLCLYGIR